MMLKQIALLHLALALSAAGWAQQPNPLIGTWKYLPAKSTTELQVRSRTNTYTASSANGVKLLQDAVDGNGQQTRNESNYTFDGKEYPVTGSETVDTAVNIRVDGNRFSRIQFKQGRIVNFLERTVSADGKTLTVRQLGMDAQGKAFSRIEVYEKQ